MLRRKLFIILGPLVSLLLISAVLSIWSLQAALERMDRVSQLHSQAAGEASGVQLHRADDEALLNSFRRIVIGLAVVFVVVINLSVIILVRLGYIILRPIDKLTEATRALAEGHYGHRVDLAQHDEFDELARAYNELAERLQTETQRQLETTAQVALAMNHEINNSISIIELQLQLLSRRGVNGADLQNYLRQIRQSLQRMTQTVQLLKSVRRIVLTDYMPGIKMLDLQRSAQNEPDEASAPGLARA